jgi:hypothetical protein
MSRKYDDVTVTYFFNTSSLVMLNFTVTKKKWNLRPHEMSLVYTVAEMMSNVSFTVTLFS